jgi:hypothetical protein
VEPTFEAFRFDLGGFVRLGSDPSWFGLLGQAWIDTDHSDGPTRGNVYVLSSVLIPLGDPAEVHFVRSEDGGETWSEPLRVNDDPEGNGAYQWFASMSVAPNGRIDAVWNDTRNYPGVEFSRLCELYYSFSTDAGETWSKNVPVSPVFDSHVGWPGGNRKLGDYYHTRSDNLGVNVAYAATFNGEQDVYFLRIGPWDCNSNEIPDEDDIASETSLDCNGNEIPDECEMLGDFDGNGRVNLTDVAAFQNCYTGPLAPPLLAKEGLGEVSSRRFTPLNTPSTTGEADGSPRRTRRVLFERRRHHGMKGEADGSPRRMRRQTFSRSRAVGYDAATESAFIGPCCSRFDFNDDGAIDAADHALFRPALRWPDRQAGR